ncbi:MAG: GerMN domain-containing protein [Armatimonadetes bacterium]|nr:GerMN domain-containing protein [Armatimonadota bacterium]MCX7966869.1 GerMN domain-containing protein [Armatimonadota bacterium]MDW8141827.1 GerMN domain-containing protein [Armatimonadota bacterium]
MQQGLKILLVALAVLAIAILLAIYAFQKPTKPVEPSQETMRVWQVTLCYPDLKSSRLVRMAISVSAASEKRVVEELLERLKYPETQDLSPALPPETKLLSVQREGDILVLNLSEEFTKPEFWQGSDVAHLRLQALVYTLTSLPNTRAVQFLVNSQVPEALGGHEELSAAVEPDPSLQP